MKGVRFDTLERILRVSEVPAVICSAMSTTDPYESVALEKFQHSCTG